MEGLIAKLFNLNFTHLKLCLADAIHNLKWVKIIQIWQNGGQPAVKKINVQAQVSPINLINYYIL